MRLSWKLFFITTPIFVLFLTFFGTWIIQDSLQNSLDQEIERCMLENQTFQSSYELTRNALSGEQWEQLTIDKAVASFYRRDVGRSGSMRIYDARGEVLYQDNALRVEHEIREQLTEEQNVGYEIGQAQEQTFVVVLCRSSFGDYIETTRSISGVYEKWDELYARYRAGVLLLTVLAGGVILGLSFFMTRNMQKLSRATRQFAQGQYDVRVKIDSRDEIGRLADDFNWMADAMKRQMEQLQSDVHRQEEFTAAFAHELKTPLTSIIGYADTIRQMELSKEETDMCADYIYRQGKRLQTLSYKLLEMTMAGKQEIVRREILARELLEEVAQVAGAALQEKQISLYVQAEEGMLFGDRDLLMSLFLNLVDNARKASEQGSSIWVTGQAQYDGYQITVADEGRGIAPEELARITEAFYMVDKSRARKEGGAGLGLALCQKIVDLHQAVWRFESEPGQGLRVTVLFYNPVRPARRPVRLREREERQRRGRTAGRRREAV